MLAELIYTQVLTELYDTNQSMNLLDEHGNTLVHAAARYHVPDCLSVRLHGCSYVWENLPCGKLCMLRVAKKVFRYSSLKILFHD